MYIHILNNCQTLGSLENACSLFPLYIIMFLLKIKGKAKMSKAITMLSRGNAAEWKPLVNCVIPNHPCSGDGSREL